MVKIWRFGKARKEPRKEQAHPGVVAPGALHVISRVSDLDQLLPR